MRRWLAAGGLLLLTLLPAGADDASVLLERVRANRPAKDITLKGRLFLTRDKFVPIEISVHQTPADTRTLYRGEDTELLVVQPLRGAPRSYLKGTGELTGDARFGRLLGSQFTYYDLGLPFLGWPNAKLLGEERTRGRDCHLLQVSATNEPYASVKLWIDKEYSALLKAEAFDADGRVVRRWSVNSFHKVGDLYVPAGMDAAFVPKGQALPAEERSRLDLTPVKDGARLPAELFDPARFAPKR